MNASEFKKLSNLYLTPKIKELSWKGNGFNFYQTTDNQVINIFGIQGSWAGGSVCCETAIHFDFLPDLSGKIEPSKISYSSCIIRERLSPNGEGDYHWYFKTNEDENIKLLNGIWDAFKNHGLKFYKDFEKFPHPFDKIQPEDLFKSKRFILINKYNILNEYFFAILLIQVNLLIGRIDTAQKFSEMAIKTASEHYGKMIRETKSKKTQSEIQSFLIDLIDKLKIK